MQLNGGTVAHMEIHILKIHTFILLLYIGMYVSMLHTKQYVWIFYPLSFCCAYFSFSSLIFLLSFIFRFYSSTSSSFCVLGSFLFAWFLPSFSWHNGILKWPMMAMPQSNFLVGDWKIQWLREITSYQPRPPTSLVNP